MYMINGNFSKKVSKKEVVEELNNLVETAWEKYKKYQANKSNENLEKFRFYFNYFYCNNKEVVETDRMYGEESSYPHFKFITEHYPMTAKAILKRLEEKGIDFAQMESLFLSIQDEREVY